MPWETRRVGEQWCVFKEGTDERVGCHGSEADADAQLRALYANEPRAASIASKFPLDPPRSWFFEPPLWFEPGMKMTVCTEGPEAGRVAATVAPRNQCLLNGGACWTAPTSPTNYAAAQQGDTPTKEGDVIRTAVIAGDLNHVNPRASFQQAVDVMAHTGTQLARVRFIDLDDHIIALGAAWPDLSDVQVRRMQAAAVSGDWRWREELGAYDLAGVIAVNAPGFPLVSRPDHPRWQPVAASLDAHPAIVGEWADQPVEVPMPEVQSMTATCSGCGGLVSVPAQPARNQTVIVAAATEPCSCQARTAAEPPMPMMDEQPSSGDVVARADFEALLARVDALEAMFMGEQLAALDAQIAALPEVSPVA